MAFETISIEKENVTPLVESYSLNTSFVCDAIVATGAIVKLKTNGEVTPVAASTDVTFGVVVCGNKEIGQKVTVQTNFSAVVIGKASAAVAVNDEVAVTGYDNVLALGTYAPAANGDYMTGVALSAGALNARVRIGIYRQPVKK